MTMYAINGLGADAARGGVNPTSPWEPSEARGYQPPAAAEQYGPPASLAPPPNRASMDLLTPDWINQPAATTPSITTAPRISRFFPESPKQPAPSSGGAAFMSFLKTLAPTPSVPIRPVVPVAPAPTSGCRAGDRYSSAFNLCYDPLTFTDEAQMAQWYDAHGASTAVAPPGGAGLVRTAAPGPQPPTVPSRGASGAARTAAPAATGKRISARKARRARGRLHDAFFDKGGSFDDDLLGYPLSGSDSPSMLKLGAVITGIAVATTGAILLLNRLRRPKYRPIAQLRRRLPMARYRRN